MNREENPKKMSETVQVTPPPFRQSEQHAEPQEALRQEPPASPTLADRIAALELDEEATNLLIELTSSLDSESVTPDMLNTLAHGATHAADVQNADAAVFPRYCRCSIWDK